MIESTVVVWNRFSGVLPVWCVSFPTTAIWLPVFAAFCFANGCSDPYDGREEFRRDEREAVAQRSTLPPSQQEALAQVKDCIPEYQFVHLVTIKNGTVTRLDFAGRAKDSHLAAVGKLPDLEVLGCNDSAVTDAGLIHLKALQKLKVIGLPRGVTGPGLIHLKDLPELRDLFFWQGQRLTDDVVPYLTQFKNLELLYLVNARITDDGLKQLSSLERLDVLNISRCQRITDKGLSYLAEFPSLRELYVRETGMTLAAITRFRRARPECKVLR